jgi:hypothetical protein
MTAPAPDDRPLFSSRDLLPPKTKANDPVRLFTESFDLDGVTPAVVHGRPLFAYLASPTQRHARRVLRAYGIPEPLRPARPARPAPPRRRPAPAPPPPPPSSETQTGGAPRIVPTSPATPATPAHVSRDLVRLDTLHDLLGDLHPTLRSYTLWRNMEAERAHDRDARQRPLAPFPPELKHSYLFSNFGFTRDAADYLQRQAMPPVVLQPFPRGMSGIDATLQESLLNRFSTVALPNNTLHAVVDNLVAGLSLDEDGSSSTGTATLALVGCAFLQMLFANLRRVGRLPPGCRAIALYDGLFLRLDGNYIERFIVHFLRNLARASGVQDVTVRTLEAPQPQPLHFNRLLGLDARIVRYGNRPYILMRGVAYAIGKPKTTAQPATQPPVPVSPIVFPHTKDDFRDLVAENPTNHDLWSLNFLRDAFKAEVALQRDALYLTHDRLAYLYYRMLGGRKGALLGLEPAVQREATVETVQYALTI